MSFREASAWFAAVAAIVACLFVAVAPKEHASVVRVTKTLEFPPNPGPGDMLQAFGGVPVKGSQTLRDSKSGQWYTCQVHTDGDLEDGKPAATWSAFVCFFNVTPPKGQGSPALAG